MNKTRRILSFVLAVMFAMGSMPMVYTGTAAAEAVPYAMATGTKENPTRPVEESGSLNESLSALGYSEVVKLVADLSNTSFTFYQTIDDEYFAVDQTMSLQHYYELSVVSRTLMFNGIAFYTGDTNYDSSMVVGNQATKADGTGFIEIPAISSGNIARSFMSDYYYADSWVATNNHAISSENGDTPKDVSLHYGVLSIGGNKPYVWDHETIFKGSSEDVKGDFNTGYYEKLSWYWQTDGNPTNAELYVGTSIKVIDAREFAKELEKAESVLENPERYTEKHVSSVEATLNSIPEDLKDFSKVYSRAEIDKYTQMLKDISKNSADYREYNETYKALSGITNAKGAYTEESFNAFKAEIAQINANLPKNLDKTQQVTVDAATQALKDAFDKLVATDLTNRTDSEPEWTSRDKGYGNIQAELSQISFKFMQTKDSQKFQYNQDFYIRRYGGYNASTFHGMYFEETYPTCGASTCAGELGLTNGTTEFLSLLDSNMVQSVTAKDENGTSITAKEFNKWVWDGSVENAGDSIVSNGLLSHGHKIAKGGTLGMGDYQAYAAKSSPVIYGKAAGDYGEVDLTYIYRLGYMYDSAEYIWENKDAEYHWHIPTTIKITDVRQLISVVDEAEERLASDELSEAQRTALQAAVDSVPVEMLRGVEYYTQAEVDKYYNDITSIPEDVADYSEFVKIFNMLTSLKAENYAEDSYNEFVKEINSINKNLPKNLPASQQDIVDAAVDALYAAYDKLSSTHLNDDNVFTQDDVDDKLSESNNPLEFSLSSTKYNYMIIADGQKLTIRTELTAKNTRSNYNVYLRGIGLWNSVRTEAADYCKPHSEGGNDGCYHLEDVAGLVDTVHVVNAVQGLNNFTDDSIPEIHRGAGNLAEFNTWTNIEGPALSSNGVLGRDVKVSTTESQEYAEMYYTAPVGGDIQEIVANYSLWLGWWYVQPFLGSEANSEETYRHVHIPVSINITDARALNALYGEIADILAGKTDEDYTFESLVNIYNAFNEVPADMAMGENYYTQDEVNAQYEALKNAYSQLEKGADYSEYFDAYIEAKEIVDSGNDDGYGNKLYDEDEFNSFVEKVTEIDNALEKDLVAGDENQSKIDAAAGAIRDEISKLEGEENTYADYTELEKAIEKAEKIAGEEEGTYTDETLDVLKELLEAAKGVEENLPVSAQGTIDSLTSALNGAIADMEYKADYSDYNKAYDAVQDIINNPGKYTDETVKAAQDAMNTAGAINKDLPDTAANRVVIKDATDVLNSVVNNADRTADYTEYNNAKDKADALVNDDGNGNKLYDDESFNEYKQAVEAIDSALERNLPDNEANQAIIDAATKALEELRATLDQNRIITQEIIDPDTTVEELLKDYNADEIIVEIKHYTGAELASTDFVGTGSTLKVTLKSTGEILDYKLFIIMGDVDGDGDVDKADYNKSVSISMEFDSYTEDTHYFFIANDMDADGVIDVLDTAQIRRMCK